MAGATTSRFAYDGLDRIADYDGANALQRRTVFDGGGQPILWYEGAGVTNRKFLSADERGSIISVTDSSGALLGINRYDEYGNPAATNLGAFGYTGQAWLPSVGIWSTRRGSTRPRSAGSCRPIRWGMAAMDRTCTRTHSMIRSTSSIHWGLTAALRGPGFAVTDYRKIPRCPAVCRPRRSERPAVRSDLEADASETAGRSMSQRTRSPKRHRYKLRRRSQGILRNVAVAK